MTLSIVVPVYKEARNIDEFCRRILPMLKAQGLTSYEVIFAMDPSPDESELVLEGWLKLDPGVRYLKFSRRVGQPMATLAGLEFSTGDAVIVMDVDLQDPPDLIPEMLQKYRDGADVVYAQRINRDGETLFKKVISVIGYKVINYLANVDIPANTGDFRLMSRRVVEHVVALKESHGFLRGMVALVGFRQESVRFERPARFAGKGNYNRFWGSMRIGLNGLFCFSNAALNISTMMGFIIAMGSFLVGISYAVAKLYGVPFPLGNPTIVIIVLFLGGVQMVSVGILGEYIGRIYDEVKRRPRFILDKKVGF